MSLSDLIIKVIGIVLAIVGLCLVLAAVGVNLIGAHMEPPILEALIGLLLLGVGIVIVRGGTITA